MDNSQLPILAVEDNDEDFTALTRAFRKLGLTNPLLRCADGDEAIAYLRGQSRRPDWPTEAPIFVLLDLNMPGTDGRAVLETLKNDPKLRVIPVIIFSTSANNRDIEDCYQLGANSYLTKPIEFAVLQERIRVLARYWLEESQLPTAA